MCKQIIHLLWPVLLVSCVLSEQDEPAFTRTLFVYIGRDNNLQSPAEEKIEALKNGWNGRNGHLVIYQDLYGRGSVLQEITVEHGVKQTRVIETRDSDNSASPEVFRRVLNTTLRLFPADSYGLVFFSHASGWLPDASLSEPRSLAQDGHDRMNLVDFAQAIPDGTFDFILFEACFMAGVEVAYELRNKTQFILASAAEILSPGFKETYLTSLNALFLRNADLTAFARKAFSGVEQQTGDLRSATFSIIRTDGLDDLADWLRMHADFDTQVDPFDLQHFDRFSYRLFFDCEDYFKRLISDEAQRDQLTRLIGNCVIYRDATPDFMPNAMGFNISRHSGLTVYIFQNEFPYLNAEYTKLAWFNKLHSSE